MASYTDRLNVIMEELNSPLEPTMLADRLSTCELLLLEIEAYLRDCGYSLSDARLQKVRETLTRRQEELK